MTDLTQAFADALARQSDWTEDIFTGTLWAFAEALPGSQVDWDSGVPGNWGHMVYGGGVAALLCRIVPLVAVRQSLRERLIPVTRGSLLTEVNSEDWETTVVSVAPDVLRRVFGAVAGFGINLECCTLAELWWSTVSC